MEGRSAPCMGYCTVSPLKVQACPDLKGPRSCWNGWCFYRGRITTTSQVVTFQGRQTSRPPSFQKMQTWPCHFCIKLLRGSTLSSGQSLSPAMWLPWVTTPRTRPQSGLQLHATPHYSHALEPSLSTPTHSFLVSLLCISSPHWNILPPPLCLTNWNLNFSTGITSSRKSSLTTPYAQVWALSSSSGLW